MPQRSSDIFRDFDGVKRALAFRVSLGTFTAGGCQVKEVIRP